MGSRVGVVQRVFRDIYNLGADFPVDGRRFDLLLDERQEFYRRVGGPSRLFVKSNLCTA